MHHFVRPTVKFFSPQSKKELSDLNGWYVACEVVDVFGCAVNVTKNLRLLIVFLFVYFQNISMSLCIVTSLNTTENPLPILVEKVIEFYEIAALDVVFLEIQIIEIQLLGTLF